LLDFPHVQLGALARGVLRKVDRSARDLDRRRLLDDVDDLGLLIHQELVLLDEALLRGGDLHVPLAGQRLLVGTDARDASLRTRGAVERDVLGDLGGARGVGQKVAREQGAARVPHQVHLLDPEARQRVVDHCLQTG
jgi:hypothetical protein